MDIGLYRSYLEQYVRDALANTDGSRSQISEYLWSLKVSGLFVRNKDERKRALEDARRAFDEHKHWPVEIVLSHLGITAEKNS
jgi:hypothetical protein